LPRASSLGADIEQHTGVRPVLQPGARGSFEVKVDGKLIFSKLELNRFPEHKEILDRLPARA
jgi:selT/selW/selH-like putative selenoprotein